VAIATEKVRECGMGLKIYSPHPAPSTVTEHEAMLRIFIPNEFFGNFSDYFFGG
jgi:hypothetical protein